MVEYIYNGKPITGVYCSDMRDMLLVKKDAFKHMLSDGTLWEVPTAL